MASLSIWLGGILLFGLVALGGVQTFLDQSATGTGMVTATPSAEPQRDLNLCMNDCMTGCVTSLDDQDPCKERCRRECGA